MSYVIYSCIPCNGKGKLEIGRNIDNKKEELILCSICNGKGFLNCRHIPFTEITYKHFMTRMTIPIKKPPENDWGTDV